MWRSAQLSSAPVFPQIARSLTPIQIQINVLLSLLLPSNSVGAPLEAGRKSRRRFAGPGVSSVVVVGTVAAVAVASTSPAVASTSAAVAVVGTVAAVASSTAGAAKWAQDSTGSSNSDV